MEAIHPINTHTKFGKDRINTFPSNERKPSIRTPDAGKSKNDMSTPQWGGHNKETDVVSVSNDTYIDIKFDLFLAIKKSVFHIRGQLEKRKLMATSLLRSPQFPTHLATIMRPFFLDIGRMPAASRVSIHFHMVSYCSIIKEKVFKVQLIYSTVRTSK